MTTAPRLKAILMLVIATACWAFSFPVFKALSAAQTSLLPDADTFFFAALSLAYRFGVSAIVLALWHFRRLSRLTRSEVEQGLGLGLFGGLGTFFQMDGLNFTEASTSAFLTQCYCVLIPIWMALRHKEKPSPVLIGASFLIVLGVGILAKVDWALFRLGRGEAETVLASALFAAQILWLQRPKYRANHVGRASIAMFAGVGVMFFAVAVARAPAPSYLVSAYASPGLLVSLCVLIFVSTLSAYLLMNLWQPFVGATEAGLIYCTEPVFASVFALLLPQLLSSALGIDYANEGLTQNLAIGGSLILLANLLIVRAQRKVKTPIILPS